MRHFVYSLPLLALAIGTDARAGVTLDEDFGKVLGSSTGAFYENGVGAPTVAYDKKQGYVMLFETRTGDASTDCPVGEWSIGVATSSDGTTWTVQGEAISPTSGTYYACVAAHPVALWDGATLHIWFKAEQTNTVCDDTATTGTWGCSRYTGVGYASMTDFDDPTTVSLSTDPAIEINDTFGYPAVTKVDGTWYMLVTKRPSIYLATSASADSGWTLDSTEPVIAPGYSEWTEDLVFNPATTCYDTDPFHPFEVFFGGRVLDSSSAVTSGGWGKGISADASEWFVGLDPYESWTGDLSWRHWDILRVENGTVQSDYLVYYTEKNSSGQPEVYLKSTVASWDPTNFESRVCTPSSAGSGASGGTGGVASSGQLDFFVDQDGFSPEGGDDYSQPLTAEEPGGGCSTVPLGALGGFGLLLLPLAALRRR